ncbi:MAG TPA: hypothetical protein VMZ53_32055, partial [Kofleriaceae bacterium]|nr:hypothetical protein [Kofleriaceae bacterium]
MRPALLAALAMLLVELAGCSVPAVSLEGKQCPCAEGFVCDDLTKRCLATNDGGTIIDTPAATSCLSESTSTIYQYAGAFDWQHEDPSWMGGAQITQTATNAMNSYAYRTSAEFTTKKDYRVIATMRQTAAGMGTPSLGIVLRAQLSPQDKSRYACVWIPKNKELRIEATHGGSTATLGSALVANTGATMSYTMEARVTGAAPPQLSCCIRELPAAKIA